MSKRKERVTPIQKIAQAAAEAAADEVFSSFEDSPYGESPIEHIFHAALAAYVNYVSGCSDLSLWYMKKGTRPEDRVGEPDCEFVNEQFSSVVWVGSQTPVGSYKADFTLTIRSWRDEKWRTLVIECDGHDFHERTKQQAAHDRSRDRWMIENGYTVFRFTGSELYRDPIKCAAQAFDMLMKLAAAGGK